MASGQNGDFRRSVISALAAIVTAAMPSLLPSTALAETNKPNAGSNAPAAGKDAKAPAKAEAKKAKKTNAPRAQKAAKKADGKGDAAAAAKPEEAHAKADAKAQGGAAKGKKAKKTASRSAGAKKKPAKKADSEAPQQRCNGVPITIDRSGLEGRSLALVDCRDRPIEASREALSVLARPWGAPKPASLPHAESGKPGAKAPPPAKGSNVQLGEVAPGVRMLDKGLLTRLAAIAKHFPGRPLSVVSGYRPQSRGSLHQAGRAIDLRVAGVSNEALVAFCKTLPDTGCGYYPNSSFVHVDVRNPGTGSVTWIDSSGPGEAPSYVKQWPPPPEESDTAVLPPDREPRDGTVDPWAMDAGDEHAARRNDPDGKSILPP